MCQLQLSPTLLATGGADGRVITFALDTLSARARIAAHDSSVTALQLGGPLLVTGGNDGRVRVFDVRTGNFVRELGAPGEPPTTAEHVRILLAAPAVGAA